MAIPNVKSETENDISAKCPICGDSKRGNKARLHLYKKGDLTLVNCFNGGCPCSNKTVYSFLRDFFPSYLPNYKKERFQRALKPELILETACRVPDPNPEPEPEFQSLRPYFGLLTDECRAYLNNRGIFETQFCFSAESNFPLGEKTLPIKGFVLVPLIKDKEIYGFYSRSTWGKSFYTYIKPNFIGYKVWNLFRVNLEEPVYIFEGIFDAISAMQSGVKNAVALMGSTISKEALALIKKPVFCFDNDRVGMKKSLEYCQRYPVVVYPFSEPKDANEMLLKGMDLYKIIMSNQKQGISATVALRSKL